MATKVTVQTHDWPVRLVINDKVDGGTSSTHEEIAPHSEQELHLTDTRSVELIELPLPASAEAADPHPAEQAATDNAAA
ncbi:MULTISPECIES: hypothetical protein [Rhodomicrobium]|uniref:hypothetical protein n=1 Tax=Rhodomicrobium TaxID=1068 RepID=UPI000B4AFBAE|nr:MULTISPECIES: hypothetical protein [Rhodomicrobium]